MQWDTYAGLVEKALTQDDLETANGIFAVGIGGYRLSMAQMHQSIAKLQWCPPNPLGLHHPPASALPPLALDYRMGI